MPELVTDIVAFLALVLSGLTAYRQFIYRRRRVIVSFLGFRMGAQDFSELAFTVELAFSNQGDLPATVAEVELCIRYPNAVGYLPLHWSQFLAGENVQSIPLASGELRHAEVVFRFSELQIKNLLSGADERNAVACLRFTVVDDKGVKRTRELPGLSVTLEAGAITGTTSPRPTQLQLAP